MPVTEFMLQNIADKMFRFILSHNYNQEKIAKTSGYDIDIIKQSLRHALSKSFEKFEERHPQWTALLLDSDFFDKEGIPILAQLLLQNSYPIISELAVLWLQKANLVHPEWYISSTREIEPIAADFLDYFIQSLASTDVMDMLHNDQTLRKAIDEIAAIRGKLRANLSTPGTRRDYLDWLINFTMYIDAQGTTHEERLSLQIKLANVYVLLDTEPASELDLVKNEITFKSDNLMEQEEVLKVSEAVNRFDHLVLLGDPGSGKTTLLHYLAHQHAQSLLSRSTDPQTLPGTPLFPILLPISDYAEHGLPQNQTLNDFLAQACIMHHCPFAGLEDLLTTALTQETCLILLDGLDEVLDTEMHSRVVEQIDHFVNSYAHRPHRFLITSRRTGYSFHPLGAPFVHYRLCDMDESQIRQFLESWCLAVEAAQTPELSASLRQARARREVEGILHAIHTSPVVQHLASNPLMLRIIASIHRGKDQLPRRRVELYDQAARALIQGWHLHLTMMEDEYFDSLLSYLAFWIHTHKSNGQVTEEEIYQPLREEWLRIKETISEEDEPAFAQEVSAFLREARVRDRAGLLVELAPGLYGFLRLSFQEYYVGRYLVSDSRKRARRIYEHRHKPRWEEPILLGLGFVGLTSPEDASALLETAILAQGEEAQAWGFTPSPNEEILGRDYLFALRCLGEQIPVRPTLERHLIQRFAEEFLYEHIIEGRTASYRKELEKRLTYLRGTRSARILSVRFIKALNDSDAEVRFRAIAGLGVLEESSDEVVDALRKKLNDSSPKVRYQAAESLRQLGYISDDVIETFLQTLRLRESVEPSIRRLAVKSLGQLGRASVEAANTLINALQDSNIEVRNQAQKSLTLLGQSHITPIIGESGIDQFIHLWDNLETGSFSSLVQSYLDELVRACELPLIAPPFSIGDWVLAAVNIESLLNDLVLPTPMLLAIVFKQQKSIDKQDLDQMIELIHTNIGFNCKLALLVLFGNDYKLQQIQDMTSTMLKNTFAFDVAVPTRDTILQLVTAHNPKKDLRSLILRHINLPSISPFTIKGPTKRTFFGRHSELSEIRDGASRISYLLIGGRLVGKTSILLQLFHVWLKEQFQPFLVSCQETAKDQPTRDDFLMTVSQLWLPNSIYEQGPSFSYIVKQLADKQDKPLVFLIDEADRLVPKEQEAGWPLFGEMRALAEKGNCQFIFAGEESLESAVKNAYSPFFNFAKKIPVGLLDKAPVFELITRTLKQQLEIEFVQENMVIERIYTFTSGHPNVVQRLCENLLTIVNKRQIRQITPADVETVIQSPSFQLNDFLQAFWSKATFLEMAISLVMAEDSRHYYNLREIRQKLTMQWGLEIKATQVQQALVRLEELRNILKRTQKGYTFAVSAFPEVIAKTVTTEDALEVLAEQFHEYGDIYLSGFNSAEELGL